MESRKDRSMSEVRKFQEFRNERNILDVTDGNRRFKKYKKRENMRGLVENHFGRKGKLIKETWFPRFLIENEHKLV